MIDCVGSLQGGGGGGMMVAIGPALLDDLMKVSLSTVHNLCFLTFG